MVRLSTGISATGGANALNSGNITGNNDSVIGIYGNASTVENASNGVITLKGNNSTGIFAKNSTVAKNTGTINLETENGSKKSVGMYGITDNTTDYDKSFQYRNYKFKFGRFSRDICKKWKQCHK